MASVAIGGISVGMDHWVYCERGCSRWGFDGWSGRGLGKLGFGCRSKVDGDGCLFESFAKGC